MDDFVTKTIVSVYNTLGEMIEQMQGNTGFEGIPDQDEVVKEEQTTNILNDKENPDFRSRSHAHLQTPKNENGDYCTIN